VRIPALQNDRAASAASVCEAARPAHDAMGSMCSKSGARGSGAPRTKAVRTAGQEQERRRRSGSVRIRTADGVTVPLPVGIDSAGNSKAEPEAEPEAEAGGIAAVAREKSDGNGSDPYGNLDIPLEFEDVDTYFDEYQSVSEAANDGISEERDEDAHAVQEAQGESPFIRWPTQKARGADATKNKERRQILAEAVRLGKALTPEQKARRILCIYNPVSGAGCDALVVCLGEEC